MTTRTMTASVKPVERDIGYLVAMVAAVGLLVYAVGRILLPFLAAFLLAYVLTPLVELLERHGVARRGAVAAIYGVFVLVLTSAFLYLIPALNEQMTTLQDKLPQYSSRAQEMLTRLQLDLEHGVPWFKQVNLAETITQRSVSYVHRMLQRWPEILLSVFTLLSVFVLIPVVTWYVLIESRAIKKAVIGLVPNRYFEPVLYLLYRVDRHLSGYLTGLVIEAIIVGLLSAIGYSMLGVPYAIMIGMLSGIANMIPYLGPVTGALAALIVTVLDVGSAAQLLAILFVAIVVQVFDNFFVQPIVMSKAADLHPLTVLVVLVIAAEAFGPWGLLFGIPAFCVGKIFLQELAGVMRRQSAEAL
ncbi:MAG: AI-2E family transporter [Nitrospiraceae bacterium]